MLIQLFSLCSFSSQHARPYSEYKLNNYLNTTTTTPTTTTNRSSNSLLLLLLATKSHPIIHTQTKRTNSKCFVITNEFYSLLVLAVNQIQILSAFFGIISMQGKQKKKEKAGTKIFKKLLLLNTDTNYRWLFGTLFSFIELQVFLIYLFSFSY